MSGDDHSADDPSNSAPRIGVVVFPGSNCEHDVVAALNGRGAKASLLWHGEEELGALDGVVVPGGFAHGDYLRPGAIARFSPVMGAIAAFAEDEGPVLGICNGFQVLTEAGLLPGALMVNEGLRFLCTTVSCTVDSTMSVLTAGCERDEQLRLPINHYEGNYTCDGETLTALEDGGQVVLRYRDNPNGSTGDIAGIANARGNVVGLMPHPERASDVLLGSNDGNRLLDSFLTACVAFAARPRATAQA